MTIADVRTCTVVQFAIHGLPEVVHFCHACEHHSICTYIPCCLAQHGICCDLRVMHMTVSFDTYAKYVGSYSLLPSAGIRPLWPRTFRA